MKQNQDQMMESVCIKSQECIAFVKIYKLRFLPTQITLIKHINKMLILFTLI